MKYGKIVSASFLSRPNRFVALVHIDGVETSVHVKNTGRCRELLVPRAEVFLEDHTHRQGERKLLYDLVAVRKGDLLINMDSQAPNKVVREALENGVIRLPGMGCLELIRPETTFNSSRFDFFVRDESGKEGFIEVKGVTLESDNAASFPDAPTERGIKHLNELTAAHKEGFLAYVIFVVQMEGMKYVTPNDERHPAFGDALRSASGNGVCVLAFECSVTPDSLLVTKEIPVKL